MYRRFGKRCFDLAVAIPLLVLLAPLMVVLALLIWARLGRPALFRQPRGGLDGSTFEICKFRSMLDARNESGKLLSDAERLTPFGRFLRSSSLDELPTLVHVIAGTMSLVGPRPLPAWYLPRYNREQARRHEVLPGVTGWAQVNGRNSISWDEKFRLDVWYVDNLSFALDLKILLMTVGKVLRRDGISAAGEATMTEFFGTAAATEEPSVTAPPRREPSATT